MRSKYGKHIVHPHISTDKRVGGFKTTIQGMGGGGFKH